MRDATLLMERPGKDPLSAGLDSSSINLKAIKPSALHLSRSDSYQHRMEVASSNIAGVTADLSRLQQQESDLKTKLLRHMAGVLGFVLSKRDEEESEYTTGPPTPCVSSNKNLWRFEGPHLFAANKDAMQPTPLSRSRRGRSATSSRDTSQNISMSNELQQQIDKLQADYTSIQSELQESRQDSESLRSQLENAQDVTSRLQQQYDQLHAESRDLQADRSRESESAARLRSQVAQYESDMHALEDQLQAASANLSALEESTRGEAGALAERLSSVERELQDAIEQKKDVQRQATELEGQLAAERQQSSEKAQQVNKFKTSLNDLAKRNSLAPLPASRSLPGADDHSTMLSWLNTQLSQTRSKAGDLSSAQSQVSSLQRQLAAKDSELQQTKRSLEDATSSVASLQRNVEQQKEHASQSSSLLPKLRDNISSLESKLAAMTSERDASQRQFTDAQNEQGSQKAEAIALQNALQDLWKALPAQREISKPGETDDLSAWKRAYSPAPSSRLPILRSNNASSGSKYSLDALSDRVSTCFDTIMMGTSELTVPV